MRHTAALAAIAALALSACNREPSVEANNESFESVAKKIATSGIKPRPGRWESQFKIESMDMPGMPPQAREMMQRQMASAKSHFTCLTPEQADRPNAEFFQKGATGCTYDHFTMADGKLDAEMTCKRGPGTAKMTMLGSYSADSYDVKVTSASAMQGETMKMVMSIASNRVGECNGTELK